MAAPTSQVELGTHLISGSFAVVADTTSVNAKAGEVGGFDASGGVTLREDASGRWVLEPDDVLLLERVYALERCPGRELRQQLATRLRVKPRQIQVWFQNKRQRMKNGAKPTVAEARAHAVAQSEHRTQSEPAELLMSIAAGSETAAKVAEDDAKAVVERAQAAVAADTVGKVTRSAAALPGADSAAALWDAVSRDDSKNGAASGLSLPSTTAAVGPGASADPVQAAQEIIAAATATVAEAHGATTAANGMSPAGLAAAQGDLADGYTDGVMLWIRTDLLLAHPELLGRNAMPIFLVNNHGCCGNDAGASAETMAEAASAMPLEAETCATMAEPVATTSGALAAAIEADEDAPMAEDDLPVAGAVQVPPM